MCSVAAAVVLVAIEIAKPIPSVIGSRQSEVASVA
jgi:hypothetical protein